MVHGYKEALNITLSRTLTRTIYDQIWTQATKTTQTCEIVNFAKAANPLLQRVEKTCTANFVLQTGQRLDWHFTGRTSTKLSTAVGDHTKNSPEVTPIRKDVSNVPKFGAFETSF